MITSRSTLQACPSLAFAFAVSALLLSGAAGQAHADPAGAPLPAAPSRGAGAKAPEWSPIEALAPVKSGPGLVVCEPVVRSGGPDAAALGTGAAMWLHFVAGGHGEFGQTPLWSALDRARRELGREDLRLTGEDAAQLSGMVGATHAAVGEVAVEGARFTLTYRLLELPGRNEVGAPFQASGSAEEVVAGLPGLARSLAHRLGVESPRVPAATGATAEELRFLGGLGWRPDRLPPGPEADRLRSLAPRIPLAGLLGLRPAVWRSHGEFMPAVHTLVRQAPENPLALSAVEDTLRGALGASPEPVEAGRKRFPHNALLAHTEAWIYGARGAWALQAQTAELLVRCAPRSPEAWLSLGRFMGESADRIRKARYTSQMTLEELQTVSRIYERWTAAVRKATEIDPLCGRAWQRLSVAATFAGEEELADRAFWNSVRLDREERGQVWWWGLEMYHPKWLADPEKHARVAREATAEQALTVSEALAIATSLKYYDFLPQAGEVLARALAAAEKAVRQRPEEPEVHVELGDCLAALGRNGEAVSAWKTALKLNPEGPFARAAQERLDKAASQPDR